MHDVDGLGELRDIEHAMLRAGVDANLLHTEPHARYRLPVVRLEATLDAPELEPALCRTSSGKALIVSRESPSQIRGFSLMGQYTRT